jgi:hypothetical protein
MDAQDDLGRRMAGPRREKGKEQKSHRQTSPAHRERMNLSAKEGKVALPSAAEKARIVKKMAFFMLEACYLYIR